MPRDAKPVYQRGRFWLGWDRKADGSLRSPNYAIFWYDPERGRERSASTGTAELGAAMLKPDAHYPQHEHGAAICPTCGQPTQGPQRFLVLDAILNLNPKGRRISASTDLYAAFRPEHLANANREIEAIIDEIEARVPGAFYRSGTGEKPNIVPMKGAKNG